MENQVDIFENFNRMAQDVLKYPMLKGNRLNDIFARLDVLIRQAVGQIIQVTTFIEDNICFQLSEIMIGAIKTKKLHRGLQSKQRVGVGAGVEIGAENVRILGIGFDLFKLARTRRELAVPLTQKILRTLRLNNLAYEQILLAFAEHTTNYCDTVDELAKTAIDIADNVHDGDVTEKMQKISQLIDAKNYTEMTVGCVDSNHLYGVVAFVAKIRRQIRRLQEEVVRAHLRLVPKVVREHTQNDNDAMDAFQAGSMGLLHAVTAFDYKSRTSFATFARSWIKQRISVARKTTIGPMLKIAYPVFEQYSIILAEEKKLHDQFPGGVPDEKLAEAVDLAPEVVRKILDTVKNSQVISFDDVIVGADGTSTSQLATFPDTAYEESKELEEIREQVFAIITRLSPESRKLLCLRFGIIEGIENSIDPRDRLKEQYRQLACKTMIAAYSRAAANTDRASPEEQ
jgi:RNA polymerase primary sigma factor